MKERCHLVYALAPAGLTAAEADEHFNDYIGDARRGTVVYHDHFVGRHGGVAIFHARTKAEEAALADPGPLAGWELALHALTFSQTAAGFAAQIDFTLQEYRGTTLAELDEAEEPDPRRWWVRRSKRLQATQ